MYSTRNNCPALAYCRIGIEANMPDFANQILRNSALLSLLIAATLALLIASCAGEDQLPQDTITPAPTASPQVQHLDQHPYPPLHLDPNPRPFQPQLPPPYLYLHPHLRLYRPQPRHRVQRRRLHPPQHQSLHPRLHLHLNPCLLRLQPPNLHRYQHPHLHRPRNELSAMR